METLIVNGDERTRQAQANLDERRATGRRTASSPTEVLDWARFADWIE